MTHAKPHFGDIVASRDHLTRRLPGFRRRAAVLLATGVLLLAIGLLLATCSGAPFGV